MELFVGGMSIPPFYTILAAGLDMQTAGFTQENIQPFPGVETSLLAGGDEQV